MIDSKVINILFYILYSAPYEGTKDVTFGITYFGFARMFSTAIFETYISPPTQIYGLLLITLCTFTKLCCN